MSLGVVSWIGAKGKQKNETCGARWAWVAVVVVQ